MKRIFTGQGVKFVQEETVLVEKVVDLEEELNTLDNLQIQLEKQANFIASLEKDMSQEEKKQFKERIDKAKAKAPKQEKKEK